MSEARVLYNRPISSTHYLMGLEWEVPPIIAGQFVMLRIGTGLDPLLRRPFGIYRILGSEQCGPMTIKGNGIEIMYKVVGRGTTLMSTLNVGDSLDILGPLGNGYPPPPRGKRPILVSGGIGIASLELLGQLYPSASFLYGARGSEDASLAGGSEERGAFMWVATEDGSVGEKGFVTDLLVGELDQDCVVYACGPMVMLKAVALIAKEKGARAYLSLERSMACGVGACLGCAVKGAKHDPIELAKKGPYRMVCSDGPVFCSDTIDWKSL